MWHRCDHMSTPNSDRLFPISCFFLGVSFSITSLVHPLSLSLILSFSLWYLLLLVFFARGQQHYWKKKVNPHHWPVSFALKKIFQRTRHIIHLGLFCFAFFSYMKHGAFHPLSSSSNNNNEKMLTLARRRTKHLLIKDQLRSFLFDLFWSMEKKAGIRSNNRNIRYQLMKSKETANTITSHSLEISYFRPKIKWELSQKNLSKNL